MSRRRAFALVTTAVAMASVMTSAGAASAASVSQSAAAAKPAICVALVVDARSIGSDVSTTCAKVPKGATGVDVLQAGGHTIGFRNDGLVCTIDGLPKSGCAGVDDTHYWAYFHRAPGSKKWVYSSEGPATYQPANDSTEGWVYDNGKALTPENVPYDQICKTKPKPSPSPKQSVTPTPHKAKSAVATSPSSQPSTPTPTPKKSKTAATSHRPKPPRATAKPPVTGASSSTGVLAGAISSPAHSHGWLDLLIGLVVVAALGAAAAFRFRRSGR
jgi:cell division septation protein DedD